MFEPKRIKRGISVLVLIFVLGSLAGCKDRKIVAYRIPKEADASDQTPSAEAGAPTQPGAHWVTPAGWQSQAASGMRVGSFLVQGSAGATADVSVITFPGDGGDDMANINRWRGQLQLAPLSAGDSASTQQTVDTAAGRFVLVDIAGAASGGKPPARIIGAWLRESDRVWFIKMMGPVDLVGAQKDTFIAFLKSFAPGAEAAGQPVLAQSGGTAPNTNDLPRGHPPIPDSAPPDATNSGATMETTPVPTVETPPLKWTAPADWQSEPSGPMRKASYVVGGDAKVAITAFPGDVGGVLANINRWRSQVGLPEVAEADLGRVTTELSANGLHFVLMDAVGSSGGQRIVAALLPWQEGTWFFKLTGSDQAVGQAKPAFLAFLKTVQAP